MAYTTQTYEGKKHYQCDHCAFDTFEIERMRAHQKEIHPSANPTKGVTSG